MVGVGGCRWGVVMVVCVDEWVCGVGEVSLCGMSMSLGVGRV